MKKSYVEYDELGIKTVLCMVCRKEIAVRSYKPIYVKSIPPRTEKVLCMKKLGSFRRKKIDLEGGAYMEAMICNACENIEIDADKMEDAVINGWEATWRHENRSDQEITKLKKALPKIERDKEKIKEYRRASMEKGAI